MSRRDCRFHVTLAITVPLEVPAELHDTEAFTEAESELSEFHRHTMKSPHEYQMLLLKELSAGTYDVESVECVEVDETPQPLSIGYDDD